jgi:AraC-like DNA-binding protein
VHVDQPWWRTTGLYILLTLILIGLVAANFFFFNRNTKVRMRCLNDEEDMMRRVRGFADRCLELHDEQLAPVVDTDDRALQDNNDLDSKTFDEVMLKVVPYINRNRGNNISFHMLAERVAMSKGDLYVLLANHIDKNPRMLIGKLRLQEAAKLLLTTDLLVEDIADNLNFVTPNYFVSSFYHQYRLTPKDYRNSNDL